MKNRYEPSNFELKQEIKRLEKSIYFYKNVGECQECCVKKETSPA